MSTPVDPKSSEAKRSHHEELNKEIVSSNHNNLTSRRRQLCSSALTEIENAPKAKRTRPSIKTDNLNSREKDLTCSDAKTPRAPRYHLPIPRLLFENEDFMDMFKEDDYQDSVRHRPDSVAVLSQCLSDAFDPFITGPPPKKP